MFPLEKDNFDGTAHGNGNVIIIIIENELNFAPEANAYKWPVGR